MRTRTLHYEALAWRKTAMASPLGRPPSANTVRAVSNFCRAIDAAGIRSKFVRLNLICGRNTQAMRTPLYRGASATGTQYGEIRDISVGLAGTDFSESTGLTGDGVSKAIDTTLTLQLLASAGLDYNNVHASVYTRGTNHGSVFGGVDAAGIYNGNYGPSLDAGSGGYWSQDAFSGYSDLSRYAYSSNSASGHKYGQDNSGTLQYWTNGANSTLNATYGGSPTSYDITSDSTPIWFLAMWNSSETSIDYYEETPIYGTGSLAAYSVGLPLGSDGAINAFYKAMQAFQTAMRRQV